MGSGVRSLGLVAIVLLLSGMTGCVDEEISDPSVSLSVTEAERWGDACSTSDRAEFEVDSGEECHEITVSVNNQNEAEDVDTDRFNWDAVTGDGAVFDPFEKRGPDSIAAGGQSEVTLLFAVAEDGQLTEIRYEAVWMSEPESATVSSY